MIILSLTVVALILGQKLIVPFIFALLIWILIRAVRAKLNEIPFVRKRFPGWLTNLLMSILIIGFFILTGRLITANVETLAASYQTYESNISKVSLQIDELLGINSMRLLEDYAGNFNFGKVLTSLFNSLRGILENTMIILLYTAFIFLEESYLPQKLKGVFPRKTQYMRIVIVIQKIERSVANYIGLKTLVNLISAGVSYFVLLFIGIDTPLFWTVLIFLLNFIPVIGLFISVLFPAVFSLIQFGTFTPFLVILGGLGTVQFLVGNILEPRIMGNSLNISPLVAILALALWGAIWGITGMFLSVPITVIMIIIFSQFPRTRPIAIMLSEKGKI